MAVRGQEKAQIIDLNDRKLFVSFVKKLGVKWLGDRLRERRSGVTLAAEMGVIMKPLGKGSPRKLRCLFQG